MRKKHMTLVLTHECNLACTYCYEHCKNADSMTLAVAEKVLVGELNADNDVDFVEIDLFGGEPFMAFDTMKGIVLFLRDGSFDKAWSISTITNGTLLTDDMKEWLRVNSDVLDCVLSYDGTPAMQAANRGEWTLDCIDLAFFNNTYPNTPIKMTVSKETLPRLAEGTIFLHENGYLVNNSLANGINWLDQSLLEEFARQLMQLVEYYEENTSVPVCGMLQFPYEDIYAANAAGVAYRPCDARSKMTCYDVDGTPYPCQQFLPISTGANRSSEIASIEFPPEVVPAGCMEDECRSCPISSVCQFCYGQNWLSRGSIYARDPGLCAMQKVLFKAKAYLAASKWDAGLLNLPAEDEKMLLEAVQLVSAIMA